MQPTTVTIVGNVTREPELRYTPSGVSVVRFGLAVNRRRQNDAGEWTEGEPEFYNVVAWRQLATNLAESLDKGTRAIVTGRLSYRMWQTEGGDKRSSVEIVAEAAGCELSWATATVHRAARQESAGEPSADASV
jgi:single-strand DNA-binding protein